MIDFNPWEETDVWDNESQYLTWIRGQLRQIWSDWPLKNEFKDSMCVDVTPEMRDKYHLHKQTKKAAQCVFCKQWFAKSHLQVDHIADAGSIKNQSSVGEFLSRLLCSKSNMQLTCPPCHKIKSHCTRTNLSFDDARLEKSVIAWLKEHTVEQQKFILIKAGFTDDEIGNATNRRKAIKQLLTLKENG